MLDFVELELYNVVCLWLRKEGLPSDLASSFRLLCTMGDTLMPLHISCNFDVVAASKWTAGRCVFAVQCYLGIHSDPMYHDLPDSVVSAARGAVSRVSDLHHHLDCSPWVEVEDKSWMELLAVWKSSFAWTDSENKLGLEAVPSLEFCCLLSSKCAGLLSLAF